MSLFSLSLNKGPGFRARAQACSAISSKEQEKTFEPSQGKIVKFERAILKHEWKYIYVETLEDGTLERINLDEGQQWPYITCEGNPTYKM